ncbi:hypothetical protein QR680_007221 [Steinernema hermaphroditum]|uniref:Uncharacterized protein n=1 Tax=Steinernema hermaphroditum TaxID=289476 RepID=A0AA39HZM6_9BILA|nr:hypothetical protein QR680_007221 [Steinernema hermaphroditum]
MTTDKVISNSSNGSSVVVNQSRNGGNFISSLFACDETDFNIFSFYDDFSDPSTPSVPVALNSAVEANRTPSYIHHELGPKPQKPKPNKRFVAIFVLAIGIALVSAVFFTLSLFKLLCPVT